MGKLKYGIMGKAKITLPLLKQGRHFYAYNLDNNDEVVVQYIYTLGAAGERLSFAEPGRTGGEFFMAYNQICNCSCRIAAEIKSLSQLKEIEDFFSEQLSKGVFTEIPPQKPYYKFKRISWYADIWYKCKICGCLWEYVKPDFPASGFVRKFPDGKYRERNF